jgi:probable phosphoglycerate mutase
VVYLVRHGQTPLNESGALRGLADPPLDETGLRQAQRLGNALGGRGLSAVIASPLLRARQTAQPVAERAGLAVSADECLLDRDYGPWTGVGRDSVTSQWGSVDRAPGVEPQSAVRERAVRGLTDIARRCPGGTAVVVSHDAVNRQVLAAFDAGLGDPDAIPQDNGCFNTLEWCDGRWIVLSVNERPAAGSGCPPAARLCIQCLYRVRDAGGHDDRIAGQMHRPAVQPQRVAGDSAAQLTDGGHALAADLR